MVQNFAIQFGRETRPLLPEQMKQRADVLIFHRVAGRPEAFFAILTGFDQGVQSGDDFIIGMLVVHGDLSIR
jgi:hypothetical protein